MKTEYNEIEFDSQEEIEFYMWCQEAVNAKILLHAEYQPMPYLLSEKKTMTVYKQLKTKTKRVEKHLFHPHRYTPDFRINLIHKATKIFPFIDHLGEVIIDVKGGFMNRGATQEFSINQKWVYEKFGVYVNKVVPEKLFKATWCPKEARLTPKTKQVKKKYAKCRTIEEFLDAKLN